MQIRLSMGTAGSLDLVNIRQDSPPTTAYLMTYHEGPCKASCGFCVQAALSYEKPGKLSRIEWPA
ncbi:MAG: radical SAM protein, partial [Candidatus Ranarchaeia archaeon]